MRTIDARLPDQSADSSARWLSSRMIADESAQHELNACAQERSSEAVLRQRRKEQGRRHSSRNLSLHLPIQLVTVNGHSLSALHRIRFTHVENIRWSDWRIACWWFWEWRC
jgi:hypothetical protein